jgi:hypothetical protein
MKKTQRMFGSLAAVAVGVLLYANYSLAAAFGVSPPWINNDNLKPDSHYVYVIDLSTNDASQEMVVTAKLTGDQEVMSWITVKDKDNLTMPVGNQHTPLYVEVNVPKDAKIGRYTGNISLTVAPRNLNPDNVSILLGGNIAVDLKVVNHDVVDFWVRSISVSPIAEGQPLTLSVDLKNMGNTTVSSLETKVQILDYKTEKPIATAEGGTLNRVIYPQTMDTAEIQVPIPALSAGQYWVKVDAIKAGKSVYSNRLFLEVSAPNVNSAVRTSVQVAMNGEAIKPASQEVPTSVNVVPYMPANPYGNNVSLRTTVTVRAPFTNQLILIVIGLLLVIVGISARIYMTLRKKEHHGHHHLHHHR